MSIDRTYTYSCKRITGGQARWELLEGISLVDVATAEKVLEETIVKACWDEEYLYLRYECDDSHMVSPFNKHDDPLYEHDVVEVFISEAEDAKQYAEIVVSPNNIVYDAWVNHHDDGNPLAFLLHTDWDAEDLETSVEAGNGRRIYTLRIPFINFQTPPEPGVQWRINFFRIDEEPSGRQHFQAWSPTGLINYHVPEKFGWIVFEE